MLAFSTAFKSDCDKLAQNMRQAEIDEVMTSGAESPYEAVKASFDVSVISDVILNDGKLVGMFGIVPKNYLASRCLVWMLTTNEIENVNVKAFIKASRYWINKTLGIYPLLYNWVDSRHIKSIKWLKLCGAYIDFENPIKCGKDEVAFYYFELKRG
ncbi:MAG: hypothetical protein LBD46_08480 [Endomicrobium sp.]|jgi:hypothetical protein|nr:hypothetical protein [Endomicrobium sp.]